MHRATTHSAPAIRNGSDAVVLPWCCMSVALATAAATVAPTCGWLARLDVLTPPLALRLVWRGDRGSSDRLRPLLYVLTRA